MLEVENIHTYYGKSHILHGISLEAGEGSVVALLGRNGMGKTTTVASIIGFNPPRSGQIKFKGDIISGLQSYQICRRGLALVPQGRRIFPSLSVKENLTIGARPGISDDSWTLEKIFSSFPILESRSKFPGNLLSGGEQQMLTIARALLTNPEFLLMDEPSEGLAPLIVLQIGEIIMLLKEKNLSLLLVEQNLPMALRVSDYTYVLSNGEIVYQSVPADLRDNEDIQSKYLAVKKD